MYTDVSLNYAIVCVYCVYAALSTFFKSPFNKNMTLVSEVKPDNSIISLHKKFGFYIIDKTDDFIIMKIDQSSFNKSVPRILNVFQRRNINVS